MTLSPSSTTSNFVALLGLSKGSILSIDGQSIILKTDDFVGIRDLPMDDWHFVTVRSSAQASITVGLVVSNKTSTVRRYDPHTEELSSIEVDESTCLNLQHQVTNGQLEPHRMIPYNRVVAAEQARLWKEQKSYVSPVLLKLRGLQEGNKIVPGSFEEETPTTQNTDTIVDGTSVIYPSIPVVPIRVGNAHTHTGTKRYLGQLSPADRTSLFFHAHPAGRLVNDVLLRYYQNQWQDLVGDIQLSYLLFLQLQCLGSLENWRDLVALLSAVEPNEMEQHSKLYQAFLEILSQQVTTIERGFFEDLEVSDGNFLVSSLKRLCLHTSQAKALQEASSTFQTLLANRFPNSFAPDDFIQGMDQGDGSGDDHDHDDDSEDGPVVVAGDEVEASLARSSIASSLQLSSFSPEIRQTYPLLVAAIMPHEDILMTCARALDEAVDVSLVREAAAYLEEMELR